MINRLKTTWLLVFVYLCVLGCSDAQISQPMEMVFFDGGTVDVPAGTTIGPVPDEIALLLFGDRDDLMGKLLGLPEGSEAAAEVLLDMICLIDAQRAYYTKYINVDGIVVMGHEQVDDAHFYNVREVILTMTSKRPELRERLTPDYAYAIADSTITRTIRHPTRFRLVIWQGDPGFPTIPEKFPNGTLRAGGCGMFCNALVQSYPATWHAAENIWAGYSVVVHEFAHAIHYAINDFHLAGNPIPDGLNKLDPTFQARLETAYAVAKANAVDELHPPLDRYSTSDYAMTNVREYWAVGVAYYFEHVALVYPKGDRDEGKRLYLDIFLKKDPLLYALLDEWFPLLSVEVTVSVQ